MKTSKELEAELDHARDLEAATRTINEYKKYKQLLSEAGSLSKKEIRRIALEIYFGRRR